MTVPVAAERFAQRLRELATIHQPLLIALPERIAIILPLYAVEVLGVIG